MPRLVISAAHTSVSPGAIYQGLREFDLTRKILELTLPHLKTEGVDFKAVPVDLQLLQRIEWINNTGFTAENGDIFLEIHVNDGGKRGIEGWFRDAAAPSNKSQKLAEFLLDEVCKATGYESQKAKSELDHELGSLLILNQTKQISTAIEFLYIDNEEDSKILKDQAKLDDLAKKLAQAIKKYLDNPPKVEDPKPGEVKPRTDVPNFAALSKPSFGGGLGGNDPFGAGAFGGGLGGLGLGGGMGGGLSPSSGASTGSANIMMDREERKKMVNEAYTKYLGKEPKQNDLNYYLNVGVSEDELLKEIVKSKEHEDIVKDAKEAIEMRDKFTKQEAELIKFRNQVQDTEKMMQNLNTLLSHKNEQIKSMHQELVRRGLIKHGEYFDPARLPAPPQGER